MLRSISRPILCGLFALALASPARAGWGVSWSFVGPSGIVTNGSGYNNAASPSGTQAAFIQGQGSAEQSFSAPVDGRYTISWQGSVRPWVDTGHDYDVMIDGVAKLRVNSWTLSAYRYTPFSLPLDLTAGKHTLRFQGINSKGGDHTSFIDSVLIKPPVPVAADDAQIDPVPLVNAGFDDIKYTAGSYSLRPPVIDTPIARLDSPKVTTSGRAIFGRLVSITNGAYLPMFSVVNPPTVKVNGQDVGPTMNAVFTSDHEGFILFLPGDSKVEAGDTVSLSAPMGWATVTDDFTEAMIDQPVEVFTGRSFVGTEAIKPTLKIGENTGHLQCPTWGTYSLTRNLRPRITSWGAGVAKYDANGFPIQLSQDSVDVSVISDPNANGIDGTGTPTTEGLYAIGWGRNATSTVDCSLVSGVADVTERADLANPGGADGRGLVRVFNFKRKPGATRVSFDVQIRLTDKARTPSLAYLVVYGPGDFAVTDNTPTTLDGVDDPAYPSSVFLTRTVGGVGTLRFADGIIGWNNGADACEPEHLQTEAQCAWNGWRKAWTLGFKQARPWSIETTPYCYSPLIGEQYPASLATALDAPASGTRQVVEVSDAETAPIIEGLVIQAGAERMRVLSVSGTAVTIERGSESTVPVAYGPGPVMVSGRTRLDSLAVFGASKVQAVELVTTGPHRLRTGNHPSYAGGPWAGWPMSDGSRMNGGYGIAGYSLGILVTGPDRYIVTMDGGNGPGNTTLAAAVDLDPAKCTSLVVVPGDAGLPYSVQARLAAKVGADLHLNFPYAASDSYVDAVARITLANFPAGRRVYLEYINEPWNWAYTTAKTQGRWCWLLGKQGEGSMLWQVRRTGQIHKRFAAIFESAGRGAEVRSILNMQLGQEAMVPWHIRQSLDEGFVPPDPAIAPYLSFGNIPQLTRAINVAGIDRAVDLWTWNLVYGRTYNAGLAAFCDPYRKAVNATNKALRTSIELYGYEAGAAVTWPVVVTNLSADAAADATSITVRDASLFSAGQMVRVGPEWLRVASIAGNVLSVDRGQSGTVAGLLKAGTQARNAYFESCRDVTYHPNFRIAEFDQFALWQRYFDRMTMNGYSMHWNSGYQQWCMYHWLGQMPGKGDGSDGKADNRLTLATPGLPGSKAPGDNQDLRNVSVRGQAFNEWNSLVGAITPLPPPMPPPTPAGIVVKAASPSTAELSWSASAGATGYSVQRSPDGSSWSVVATPAGIAYVDAGLAAGTTYSYRVAATNAAGTSAYSGATSVTTPTPPPPPPDLVVEAADLARRSDDLAVKIREMDALISDLKAAVTKLQADIAAATAKPMP